ncbi:hypothetical protein ABB37_07744 [Leptomonas pyrrhocoris]|uniref:Uncharacterized protein n=1 Tax=Leptomonas pyrrhocoris TaxID=157538 RepID=A0A0N0VDZ3_LEPPY|nr:hypothetical protein ABB37_07744 [Leptomonas pyrrhocoris]KPA76408.1 hypothetical protein ABB37_07744 [Leptomonas pyrrhocoris]|eukprot:XP_015654847.1 hypothetical protein ABB37_07744 [Leptomonas pyrrhocoris]
MKCREVTETQRERERGKPLDKCGAAPTISQRCCFHAFLCVVVTAKAAKADHSRNVKEIHIYIYLHFKALLLITRSMNLRRKDTKGEQQQTLLLSLFSFSSLHSPVFLAALFLFLFFVFSVYVCVCVCVLYDKERATRCNARLRGWHRQRSSPHYVRRWLCKACGSAYSKQGAKAQTSASDLPSPLDTLIASDVISNPEDSTPSRTGVQRK